MISFEEGELIAPFGDNENPDPDFWHIFQSEALMRSLPPSEKSGHWQGQASVIDCFKSIHI
jgi:hypothetical protein